MNKKVLITGITGLLGSHCLPCAKTLDWEVYGISRNNSTRNDKRYWHIGLDLTDTTGLRKTLDAVNPDAVIHLAALPDVNTCFHNKEYAWQLNVEVTASIAEWCAEHHKAFVFTSTDLVFDGTSAPYDESALPNPLMFYGKTKHQAETVIMRLSPKALIVRLPLLYGIPPEGRNNFLTTVINSLKAGTPLKLFRDEYRTPAWAGDVARGIFHLLENKHTGIFHLGGPQRFSRLEWVIRLASLVDLPLKNVESISINSLPLPEPRPHDVSLNSSKARKAGFACRPLEEVIPELLPYI